MKSGFKIAFVATSLASLTYSAANRISFADELLNKKRIVVVGDGAESLIITYMLSKEKDITNNYNLFLIYGDKTKVEKPQENQTNNNFITRFLKDEQRSRIFEFHFFRYLYSKYFKRNHILKESPEYLTKSTYDIILTNENNLLFEGQEAKSYIQNDENVSLVMGEVPFIHRFGEYIGHIEMNSHELKSLKLDKIVLCNTYYLHQIMKYIKLPFPFLRMSHDMLNLGQNELNMRSFFTSKWSYISADEKPILGRSSKCKNLYYSIGSSSSDLSTYIRNAEIIKLQLLRDIGVEGIPEPEYRHSIKSDRFSM